MFDLVIATSHLVRKMKDAKVIVSQKKFVNDAQYRKTILDEARRVNDPEMPGLIERIEQNQYKF